MAEALLGWIWFHTFPTVSRTDWSEFKYCIIKTRIVGLYMRKVFMGSLDHEGGLPGRIEGDHASTAGG